MSKLYIVGIGPGSDEYLTVKAGKIVESVELLVGSKRALGLFQDSKVEKMELDSKNMENSFKNAVFEVENGKSVALLSTGDPGFSGILKPVLELSKRVEVEVVPGISSIQLCASKLQISWSEVNLITLHGKGDSLELLKLLDNGKPTMILPNFNVKETAKFLLDKGIDPARKVAICEKLSYPDERIVKLTLKNVLNDDFSYMCVMVIF
jgi:cobalt-precorrin-7 (C5)-methyltransferase